MVTSACTALLCVLPSGAQEWCAKGSSKPPSTTPQWAVAHGFLARTLTLRTFISLASDHKYRTFTHQASGKLPVNLRVPGHLQSASQTDVGVAGPSGVQPAPIVERRRAYAADTDLTLLAWPCVQGASFSCPS